MSVCFSASIPSLPHHQHKVKQVIQKQVLVLEERLKKSADQVSSKRNSKQEAWLQEAYKKCGEFCAQHGSNFYLGTFLLTPERRKAAWAIHGSNKLQKLSIFSLILSLISLQAWGKRTDDLVDDSEAESPGIMKETLDQWQERLENIFTGRPADMMDEALTDTISRYSLEIEPFQDIIDGMRMDLMKSRYSTFDELYLYCYNVSGTVSMMLLPILGIPLIKGSHTSVHLQKICSSAVSLGVAAQLTNILRDVSEDASRGRIYLPLDELKAFGLSEADVLSGRVTENWRAFTKAQIRRARRYFGEADKVVFELDKCSRWPVCASLSIYQQILDSIEANDYDNLTVRASVPKWKKLALLPVALIRALT